VCLFGPAEVSLRDAMREGATDEQLRRIVGAALMKKQESHDAPEVIAATKNRSMIRIGG
jgi:cyclic pyranopterin phosphate synthase